MKSIVLLAVLLSGCTETVNAHVDCVTTATPSVECTITQKSGKSEVEVCWDFAVTCGNGGVVKASRTCGKVKDGGTTKVTIPAAQLTGIDQCGGTAPPTGALTNMTIDGKPTTK